MLSVGTLFAQGEIPMQEEFFLEQEGAMCEEFFTLNGPSTALVGETLTYTVISNIDQTNAIPISYRLQVKDEGSIVQKTQDSSIQITFWELGSLLLSAEIQRGECTYHIEKDLNIFQNSILYIGDKEDAFQLGFDQNFAEKWTYLDLIFLDSNEGDIKGILGKSLRNLNNASTIIIKSNLFDEILSAYTELIKQELVLPTPKTIYIVSNSNQSFLNRVLSVFVQSLGEQQLATVKQSDFLNFLSALSLSEREAEHESVAGFSSFHSLQDKSSSGILFLSTIIDQAITNGVSLNTLGILLVIALIVLVISILRQVVGLSVFWVYQPLLFGLTLFLMGWKTALFIFILACLITFVVRAFCKKVQLLHNAKVSLLIGCYILFFLFWIRADNYFWWGFISKSIWNNGYIVLPILIIAMVNDKLFTENFKVFSKAGWIAFLEFIIVSGMCWWILETQLIRNFMLSYPELLLVILILGIIIGRFSGLQLFELIRFMPLIKKHLEDEEE